jgi:hypothetical protein
LSDRQDPGKIHRAYYSTTGGVYVTYRNIERAP